MDTFFFLKIMDTVGNLAFEKLWRQYYCYSKSG